MNPEIIFAAFGLAFVVSGIAQVMKDLGQMPLHKPGWAQRPSFLGAVLVALTWFTRPVIDGFYSTGQKPRALAFGVLGIVIQLSVLTAFFAGAISLSVNWFDATWIQVVFVAALVIFGAPIVLPLASIVIIPFTLILSLPLELLFPLKQSSEAKNIAWCKNCVHYKKSKTYEDSMRGTWGAEEMPRSDELPCKIAPEAMETWAEHYETERSQRTLYPKNCSEFVKNAAEKNTRTTHSEGVTETALIDETEPEQDETVGHPHQTLVSFYGDVFKEISYSQYIEIFNTLRKTDDVFSSLQRETIKRSHHLRNTSVSASLIIIDAIKRIDLNYDDGISFLSKTNDTLLDEPEKKRRLEEDRKREEEEKQEEKSFNSIKIMLDKACKNESYSIISHLDLEAAIDSGIVDNSILKETWATLQERFRGKFDLGDQEINSDDPIANFFGNFDELFPNSNYNDNPCIYSLYAGNSHGGQTNLYTMTNDSMLVDVCKMVTGPENINGLIEIFYLFFEIPKKGRFWHGLYDHTYKFIFDQQALVRALMNLSESEMKPENIDVPAGLRVNIKNESIVVSCLSIDMECNITDKSIIIKNDKVEKMPDIIKIKSGRMILF
tara:strand:+ start:412 stop:2232 length:1821 start_codon:yes stop_codon:yes gene_type:complete